MARAFHIVDVFAEQPYAGNPLAVVTGSDDLTDDTMQRIAAEANYSETTFVANAAEPDGAYRVRIFTPAWVIRRYLAPDAAGPVRLNLQVGQVPVTFEGEGDNEVA